MKIGILSRAPNQYSTKRLVEAAENRSHDVSVVDYLRCHMNIATRNPKVVLDGDSLIFDAVIPRIATRNTFYGTAVVRQFEVMGIYSLNESQAITRSRDKMRSLQILSRTDVGMPITSFADSTRDLDGLIEAVGGAPLVIKLLEGKQRTGIVLVESKTAAKSVIAAFRQQDAHILIQEFIREAKGTDIRCLVVGDRVIAAQERRGLDGKPTDNLYEGEQAIPVKLSTEERKMALTAVQALGLNVAGVDLIRSDRGPLVIDVNSLPSLEGVEAATGIDVAGLIIEYIESNNRE
jgi:ribosomal protein S6--L-glutamate ligase